MVNLILAASHSWPSFLAALLVSYSVDVYFAMCVQLQQFEFVYSQLMVISSAVLCWFWHSVVSIALHYNVCLSN